MLPPFSTYLVCSRTVFIALNSNQSRWEESAEGAATDVPHINFFNRNNKIWTLFHPILQQIVTIYCCAFDQIQRTNVEKTKKSERNCCVISVLRRVNIFMPPSPQSCCLLPLSWLIHLRPNEAISFTSNLWQCLDQLGHISSQNQKIWLQILFVELNILLSLDLMCSCWKRVLNSFTSRMSWQNKRWACIALDLWMYELIYWRP